MPQFYGNCDLERKFKIIKDGLYTDGFYSSSIICRVIVTTGGDDIYDLAGTVTITDTVISAIVERGPIIYDYNNQIEVASGDIRLTVRTSDSSYVDASQEIWIDTDLLNGLPIYESETTKKFTEGKDYIIRSKKPSIFGLDDIYILKMNGELE